MTYVIKASKRIYCDSPNLSFVEVTLNKNSEWCVATNEPMRFSTLGAAQGFYTRGTLTGPQCGTDGMPYVVGQNGKHHSAFNSKLR
mgnify:CR=1 FL=1